MSFTVSYQVGGRVDKVKQVAQVSVVEEVKRINFPEHLFPTKHRPFTKGFRMSIPAMTGTYETVYTPEEDMELVDIGIACSGYADNDYWELLVGDYKVVETMYTKELPEHINMGTTLYVVHAVPAGTPMRLQFHNDSGTSKTVWFNLRFLR